MYITIRTSQRNFTTDHERWLGRSAHFTELLSKEVGGARGSDSYFIETNAHIFEHILRYLRTGVLPVFYDRVAGHDFPLYQALLEESKYLGIDRLQRWLCERKYLDAVKIQIIATETQDRSSYEKHTTSEPNGRTFMVEDRFLQLTSTSNTETTIVPVTQQRNSFYCPNGKHGKSSEEYCRSCFDQASTRGISGYGGWRGEEELKWCIVRKEVVFDHELCANAFLEDD